MRKIRSLVVFMLTFFMAICLFACAKTGNYKFARVDWKEDGTGATVILVDESDSSKKKEVEVEVTLKEHKDATCDEPAKNIYEVTYEGVRYTKELSVGKALGHDWEFVRFDWSTNCKTANAVLVCKRDSSHTKEVPATMTSVKKTDPTCGAKGITTYTATYETHTESQDVADIEEIDHEYQFDHFVWNDDYTAKAILVCKNNSEHVKEKNAVVTSKIVTPATCGAEGLRQYTATYLTYSDTKEVKIEALGHNYQFDHFNWAEDYKSATAVLVCSHDSNHTIEVAATVTSIIKTPATCEANGITTYTATYETHTESKDASDIEALGHKYVFNHFEWTEDYKAAKAILVCENNPDHTKEESVNVVENQFDTYNSYTATYGSFNETRKVSLTSEEIYTVDFRNADNELISTTDYKKGDTVVVPANPTMDDETYTYVFKSWDKEVSLTAQASVTYKAVYEKTYKEYEIIFETEDHKEISKAKYHYGDDIVFPTENPEKEADSKYTYLFAGWNQMPRVCMGNMTYTAMYRPVYIEYEITFVNFDDKEISTKKYHYDDEVVVPANPTKEADNTYTYEFAGWDSEVSNVNGNKVYKATYKSTYIDYVVEFVDAETKEVLDTKTYHYNDELVAPTTFTKEKDNTYTYAFDKIDGEVATKVTENVTYTVIFTKTYIEYEIIFETEDHKEISKAKYHYGDDIVFPTENPEKEADSKYTYLFAGWNQMPRVCMGNMTYTAMYRPVYIEYEITFVNFDDKEISTKKYHYDDEVVVPETPTRASDNTYTYEFKAWDSEVTKVDGTKTYKAVYEATYIEYEITFLDYDDNEISKVNYHYGDKVELPEDPTRAADLTYTYEFAGWSPEVTKVDGAATYTATYKEEFIVYTVIFLNYDGKEFARIDYHYGEDILLEETPEKPADEVYRYEFSMWSSETVGLVITYTPVYTPFYIDYEIVFVNYDDKEVSKDNYHYGDEVVLPKENPTRAADNTYTYEFNGWTPEIIKVDGAATYKAEYKETYIEYTVTFMDGDKTVSEAKYHYNDKLVLPDNPKDYKTDTIYYEFDGWDKDVAEKVTESVTYNATYYMTLRQEHNVISYEDVYNYVYNGDKIFEPSFNILDGEEYILEYSIKGEDNFTTEAPSELGEYTLRVTVPENNYYLETIRTYDLVIAYKNNTFVNIGTYEFPDLLVEFNKFGKLIKAVGRSDLGYKFIDEYDIDGITPKGLVELYNEVLLTENYDKLAAYYKKVDSFYIPIKVTKQPKGTNYIENEIDEVISNLKNPACDYDVYGVELGNFYLGSYMTLLGANNIDDIEERYDDIIDTLSLTNSYEVTAYYLDSLEFHILYTVSNYYLGLLEQINSTDAENYIKQINSYRDLKNTDYLDDYNVYYLNPYYTTLLVQYNDSMLGLKHLLTYCRNENDIDYFASRYNKNYDAVINYNPGEESLYALYDAYAKNIEDFHGFITDSDFLELISNLYDEKDLLAAIKLGFDHAKVEMLRLDKTGNAQNIYYLDQRTIVGTNKYHYVDEYAEITYLFNEYNFMDKTYYLGYIIDGAYSKEGALDSSVEKHVLDIFSYEDKNGYIDYINYKGINDFYFNFRTNEFHTCEGELVYVAYSYDLEGRPYTFRLNKDGDNLISYVYYGHWTKEELIKRVSEPADDHFGEESAWYYEGEFIIVETENSKIKFVVDPDDEYVLKEYQLEFDYDDLVINFYHKDDIYVFAFVTIDNEKYVFYYPIDTTYEDIKGGLVTPILGLNGTINWEVNDSNIISVSYDDYVYVITAQGLVKKDGDETYYTRTLYTFEDGNDEYDLILNVRYNGKEYHYVDKNGESTYYSWSENKTSVFVTEEFEIKYMFTKTDNGLVELDYDNATKKILYSGYDLNEEKYFIIYELNGYVLCNLYNKFNKTVEDTFASDSNGIFMVKNTYGGLIYIYVNDDHCYYFEVVDNELIEVAPEGYEIVIFENEGDVFYKQVVAIDETPRYDYIPTPTKPYDETYYYCFEGWNLDSTLGGRTFVAQYSMLMRDKTVIVTDGYIDYAYDGKEVPMPTYQTNSDGKAAMYYKLIDADDDAYTLGMPKEVGRYYVKLVIEGTEHYLENYKIIELDIELPTKQYVMFHYLTYINLLVDETGYVVDTNTLDQVLNPVLEEACVIGLTIEEATRALVDAYNKLGLFALKTESTKDNSNIKFGAQVFSCGEYAKYFMNIIKNAADEELEALDLGFECLMHHYDVKEWHLPNFTLLSENEIDELDQYETIEYFLDNCLLTTYYSYGFNEYVVNLEPIYTFYAELEIISNALQGYSGEAYDALKNAITSVITILNKSIDDINAEAAKVLKNDSKYFYLRNDFYNALNTYMEAYQNDDDITLQLMPPLGIMEFFDDMMNSKDLEALIEVFNTPTNDAKALRASLFASSNNVALMEEALAKYDYTFDSIHELAQNKYINYIDIMRLSFDYDLEEMPRDVNLIKDKGIAEFYLMNDLEDETWIFVDLSEYDALKETEYEYICYVYEGQFTLGQYNYIDAKLLRFFRYFKDWDNKNQYYEIEICDYSNLFTSMLKAYKDKQEIPMPELGRGDLKHVAHMEMSNMIMTFGLFNDDGDKVAFAYMGDYTFDDVLNGRVSMPSETIFNWSSKDGKYTVFFETIMYTFVEDENDSRLLVANELVMNDIKLIYSRKEDAIIYAYVVADGKNYLLAYMGNTTEEDIESGKAKPVLGNGGTLTWEIITDNALISYIGEDVYSAHYVTYDEQNKEYIFDRIDRYDLKSYKVAYTYTNDTYSYLLLNGLSYYGNTFHDAYRFDGVLTLEEMLESFGKPNDSKHYMWSEYDNSVVLDNQGKVVKVFIKNDGKLQEVEEKSKQIVTLNYNVKLYLIVDEFGIVTNAYGEEEYSNYFLNNHDLEDIYLKDAIIEFLNGLNDDGYFILAKDIFQKQKDRYFDTVRISSTIENNMTDDIEAVMETIRDDINISWSVFDPRSNLTAISINTADVSKMTLEEATKELIHRYEIASKYSTGGYKYYALYYKDIYEFVSLLDKYQTALEALTTDSTDKYATALTKVKAALDAINNYKSENGWESYSYIDFLTPRSPYLYERNAIYNDIIALLKSIQNNNEYEINSADYDKIFGENFAQNEFRAQMIQFSNYLVSVHAIKTNLYDELGLDIINDIYSYYTNGGTTLDTILSSIEEAYINELDIYADVVDINVLESNIDFLTKYDDYYEVEYIYHDGYANETWVFVKWEDGQSYSFFDEDNNVYSVCYVFDGLFTEDEIFDYKYDKDILRFAEYQKDVFGNIRVTGPYMCNEVVFNVDENDTLSLTEPEGNLEYVAHFKYNGATFTFGFYDDGKAYQYYGEYSYKELKSRRVKVWNSGYTWKYYGEADLYSLSAIGTEVLFYLDDDGYLYEYVVDFSDINITYLVPFDSVTLVFSTDDKDNQYAYVFNGLVDEDTIKAGAAKLAMGGLNNLGWYGDESCLVMTLNGDLYRVIIYKEGNYSLHDPNEVTYGDYYYVVINDDYSLLFTLVKTILGEEKFNVYEYPVGTTLDEMLNAYKLTFNPGCEAVYGWKETETDVYVYNYSNNEIIMKFTRDGQDLKAYELNTRSYRYIYFDENDNTYACYIVNSFKICYYFDREVLYTELNENLANYTREYLWDEDVYGRITLADFKNYFELFSMYGSALVEVEPLEFNEEPTIDYVLLDKDYNMTYILFEADGYNYTYVYKGQVTSKEFGKVEPVRGIKGDVSWYLEDNKILITYQSQIVKTAVYKNGEYVLVSLNDIESYEIKYIYLGEEYQKVFVEAVTYGKQSIYDVLSWPLDATVEQIELGLYDHYNPDETVVIGKTGPIDFTWVESDSSVAVIMSRRKQASVISDKYLKQENSIYLTDYEVKTQELKYTYSDDEYIYMLYIENGLMICYSYDKNNQEGDIVNSYCWHEYKGWGVTFTIDAFTDGEVFVASDTDPTILVLAGKNSGTPIVKPISGNPKSPIMA